MSENPVLNRLIGHNPQPTLRVTIIVGLVLLIVSATGAALWMLATPGLLAESAASEFAANALSWGVGQVFQPAMALIFAVQLTGILLSMSAFVMASYITSQETRSEAFTLLQTTNVQPHTITRGLAGATLFRLRVPLASLISLMPLMFVSAYQKDFAAAQYGCLVFVPAEIYATVDVRNLTDPCALPDDPRLFWTGLRELPGAIGLIGMVLLAIALGASLTLWLRSPWKAAAVVVGILVVLLAITLLLGPGPTPVLMVYCAVTCTRMTPWPPVTLVDGILLPLIPFALAWVSIRFARYRAPK